MLTHAKMKKIKETPITVKPDNPNRIHMTHAEVMAENAAIKADRDKVRVFEQGLEQERKKKLAKKEKEESESQDYTAPTAYESADEDTNSSEKPSKKGLKHK